MTANYSLKTILSQISELFPDPDNVSEITVWLTSAERCLQNDPEIDDEIQLDADTFSRIFSTVDLLLLRAEIDFEGKIEEILQSFLESIEDVLRTSSESRNAFKQFQRGGGLNALLSIEGKLDLKVFLFSYFAISVTESDQGWEVVSSDEEKIANMFEAFLPTINDLLSQKISTPLATLRRFWSSLIMLASHDSISKNVLERCMLSNIPSVLEQSSDIEITKMILEFVWGVTLLRTARGQIVKNYRELISSIEAMTQHADQGISSMAKNVIWNLKGPKEKAGSPSPSRSSSGGKHRWLIIYSVTISVLVLSVVLFVCFSPSTPPHKGSRHKSVYNTELYSRDSKINKQEDDITQRHQTSRLSIFRSDVSKWLFFCVVSLGCHALLALVFKYLLSNSVGSNKREVTTAQMGGQQTATDTHLPHVMISYCWAQQKVALDLQSRLEDANIKVWIDVNQMHGFLAERMSEAVENSYAVIMLLSSDYKQSFNCKSEANYSHTCRKTIIPLIAQRGFLPSRGWLSFIIAGRLYYQCFDSTNLGENFPKILAELQKARDI